MSDPVSLHNHARLDEATLARLADAWSVVCAFESPPVLQRNPAEAWVRFLSDAAPYERLRPGALFSLYEGRATLQRSRSSTRQHGLRCDRRHVPACTSARPFSATSTSTGVAV